MNRPNGFPIATWSMFHTPASATQATVTQAAILHQRHVITHLSATLAASATAQSAALALQILDGVTVVWAKQIILPINGVWEVQIPMHFHLGHGTAVTVNFSGAGAAGTVQSIAVLGYTINESN